MTEEFTQPDTSGRGLPIFFALAFGLIYLVGSLYLFGSSGKLSMRVVASFPIAQFLYIGPLAYFAIKSGRKRAMQGWLIGAAIAALIYAPCWGMALSV